LKDIFVADKIPHFLLLVNKDYPSLSDKEIKDLLLLVATYLCKTVFSSVAVMKKNRSCLITEKDLRLTFS
jgi:hypothetical protein